MRYFSLILIALLIISCDERINQDLSNEDQFFVDHYAHASKSTNDALSFIESLEDQFDIFVENPNQENFNKCQVLWQHSRVAWSQSELFGINLVNQDIIDAYERINKPFRNTLILENENNNGIIQDTENYPNLLPSDLRNISGIDNIYGFHAVEYLLWGLETDEDISLSGSRDWNDFVAGENSSRYQTLLRSLVTILIEDLRVLVDHYTIISQGISDRSLSGVIDSPNELKDSIFNQMSLYLEKVVIDQRVEKLYITKDISLEESPFSDYSLADLRFNVIGIESILEGEYIDTEGKISNFIPLSNFTDKSDTLRSLLSDIKSSIALLEEPLDARIAFGDSDAEIEKLINELKSLNGLLK